MAVPTSCPEMERIRALFQVRLPLAGEEELWKHLEQCPACAATVEHLLQHDTLHEANRTRAVATPADVSSFAEQLLESLNRLPEPETPSAVATVALPFPCDHPDARLLELAAEPETYSFLAPPQEPGELGRLAHFRILGVLGKGGMGVVFEAEDLHLARPVALKVMKPELAHNVDFARRFLHEARAIAALRSEHIVTVYEVRQDRGVLYLAMELLEGEALDHLLRRGQRLPVRDVVRLGREVAEGLAVAHEQGLIHRDVKPANIFLQKDEGGRMKDEKDNGPDSSFILPPSSFRVKLLDFGLVRTAGGQHLTHIGMVVGTPLYMSPEQAGGESIDARADLFSLGCVLYRLLGQQLPFQGPDIRGVLTAVLTRSPRPLQQLDPTLPRALTRLVMQLLAKKPSDRPSSAREVAQRLAAIERAPLDGPAPRRRSLRWRVGTAALLLAALGVAASQFLRTHQSRETEAVVADQPRPEQKSIGGDWVGIDTNDRMQAYESHLQLRSGRADSLEGTWNGFPIHGTQDANGEASWHYLRMPEQHHYRARGRTLAGGQVLRVDYTVHYQESESEKTFRGTTLLTREPAVPLGKPFVFAGHWSGIYRNDSGRGTMTRLQFAEADGDTVRGTWDGEAFAGRRTGDGLCEWNFVSREGISYHVSGTASHAGHVLRLRYTALHHRKSSEIRYEGWALLAQEDAP